MKHPWLAQLTHALMVSVFTVFVFWVTWQLTGWGTEKAVLAALFLAVWLTTLRTDS